MSNSKISRSENGAFCLPTGVSRQLRTALQSAWKNFIFRTVTGVRKDEQDLNCREEVRPMNAKIPGSVGIRHIRKSEILTNFEEYEVEQYITESYSRFTAYTSDKTMRPGDAHRGKSISLPSRLCTVYSPVEGIPVDKFTGGNPVHTPPRVGDLVCIVANGTNRKGQVNVKEWWVCSEQFLRAWTLIMFDDHVSFTKKAKTEERVRQKAMQGNGLATNSWLKLLRAHEDNNVPFDFEESVSRYWNLRCEITSRRYVHILNALVLMARWGELPSKHNVPQNAVGLKTLKWDLPENFVELVLGKFTDFIPEACEGCFTWASINRLARGKQDIPLQEETVEETSEAASSTQSDTPKIEITVSISIKTPQRSWADQVEDEEFNIETHLKTFQKLLIK